MSNKLYTEEQVREILKSTHIHTDNDVNMILPQFTPIELLSDDEIYDESINVKSKIKVFNFDTASFEYGARWMRDKIQGGNNEQ